MVFSMNNTHFCILLGGRLKPTERLHRQIAGRRVIAADGGMVHAETLGVQPEVWVGDFDSADPDLQIRHESVPRLKFPADKNATDGELAVEEALARGAGSIVLAGGLGGQSDHIVGHFTLAVGLARRDISVVITSGDEEGYALLPGRMTIDVPAGSRVSILPFCDLSGLTLEGVKWPLKDHHVGLGSSLTLSNEATGPVTIGLGDGYGMAIAYPSGLGLSPMS